VTTSDVRRTAFQHAGAAWFIGFAASGALAAPDAGQLSTEIHPPALQRSKPSALPAAPEDRPALALDAGPRVRVERIIVTGSQAVPAAELDALLADAIGKTLSLPELQALAARVTRRHREAGLLLARAYLPVQRVDEGRIEIAVLEGRLGRRQVSNDTPLADARLGLLQGIGSEGDALRGAPLERALLLLSDLPGIDVQSTLRPGASVGTTDLDVRVMRGSRASADLSADNFGNPSTGSARFGAGAQLNNPMWLGDTLSLRTLASDGGLSYGRIAYQLPVGDAGTQLGAAGSDMRYRLGGDFLPLQASGTARIASAYLLHPLQRSRDSNLNLQLLHDRKQLHDGVGSTGTSADKRVAVTTLGLSGDRTDASRASITQWSISWTEGRVDLDGASAEIDETGYRTRGRYHKLSGQWSHQRPLDPALLLALRTSWQATTQNLDSSEQMGLGGSGGVRAYGAGEASSDDAALLTVELRHPLSDAWQLGGFVDAAFGRAHHQALPNHAGNVRHPSGVGALLSYRGAAGLNLNACIAMRTGDIPQSDSERGPRWWLLAVQTF
jgi:hemolysin activation/secretion protein